MMFENTRAYAPRLIAGILACITTVAGDLATSPAAAEPLGYTTDFDDLQILDFADGQFADVAITESLNFWSLALAPDGRLFGVGIVTPPIDPNAPRLWIIDRETGETTGVGNNIGESGSPGDLPFDAAGNLWMTHGGRLFAIDPDSGARTEIGGTGLIGLADRDGVLFSFRKASVTSGWDLVTVDPTTGDATSIAPLPPLDSGLVDDVDLSSGANGELWALARKNTPSPIPSLLPHALYVLEDPTTGTLEEVHDLGFLARRTGLTVLPPVGIVAIPTLGSAGLILLALALVLAAWGTLKARPRSAR